MPATIWGVACGEESSGDVAARYHRSGRLAEAHAFRTLDTRLLPSGTQINIDHDAATRCGEVVHAELGLDDRLGLVGVIDVDADLLDRIGPVYWSPELVLVGPGLDSKRVAVATRAGLTGVAVTTTPATLAARELAWLAGDLRRSSDRYSWEVSWRSKHPLLARAVDQLPVLGAEQHRARSIIDRRARDLPAHGWINPDGRPVHGPLRYGPPGRILAVR